MAPASTGCCHAFLSFATAADIYAIYDWASASMQLCHLASNDTSGDARLCYAKLHDCMLHHLIEHAAHHATLLAQTQHDSGPDLMYAFQTVHKAIPYHCMSQCKAEILRAQAYMQSLWEDLDEGYIGNVPCLSRVKQDLGGS